MFSMGGIDPYLQLKILSCYRLSILLVIRFCVLYILQGAQIFEAVGLHQEVIDVCFVGTASRLGGATFDIIAQEVCTKTKFKYKILDP